MHIYGKTDIEANQDGFSLIEILIAISGSWGPDIYRC